MKEIKLQNSDKVAIDAAKAYNVKALELFGEYAYLNDVDHTNFVRKERVCSSNFRGVNWLKTNKKWRAYIVYNGKQISLGCFDDEIEAALVYNKAAIKYHGDKAILNEI